MEGGIEEERGMERRVEEERRMKREKRRNKGVRRRRGELEQTWKYIPSIGTGYSFGVFWNKLVVLQILDNFFCEDIFLISRVNEGLKRK